MEEKQILSGKKVHQKWWASNDTLAQLLRYGVVGVVNNFAGYFVYLLVTYLGATPKLTMSILYGVGAAIGYLGNRKLTFVYAGNFMHAGFRYVLVHIFGYLMNFMILLVFVDRLGYPHQLVQAVAIFVVAAFLFAAFKLFVFRLSN